MNRQEIFRNMLKKDETMRIGVFALGILIGLSDNELRNEEHAQIKAYLNQDDCTVIPTVREKFQQILARPLDFTEIKNTYLDCLSNDELIAIDEYVCAIIDADGIFSEGEKNFVKATWNPFLTERGIKGSIIVD